MSETTTHIPEEKSRIGAPSIPGFTEEGENLSPINDSNGSPLGGASSKAHSHGGGVGVPDSSRAGRLTSYNVEDFAKLTGREEDWRFTPLKRLKGLHTDELTGVAPKVELTGSDAVVLTEVAADDVLNGIAHTPDDRVSANAWKYASSSQVVTVPKGAEGVQATLRITGESLDAAAQHIIVVAEENTEATIILDHVGSAVLAQNIEFDVRADARLTVISLQAWENDAVHASSQQALVAAGASFKHIAVTFGGDLVRVNPSARFTGERAEIELYGLYFADAGQHQEHRLFVDHAVANCKSNVLYKGALQGKDAHTVWVGDVLIQKAAVGTDSYEANRNLVLTDGARADSVPNLEIETGLIDGAGHASTTGRFDDEHLFYLMARGIDEKTARRLVVRGFLNEIVQQIGDEALQERLTETIESELAATDN
ncbi:Fe-S cluster assembly protein SufD [Arthrobacter sp. LS16]|uniref:Fe-S cluster assembly protein SufD n=1 Tax=Glutamicibacter soli TaxID=453836 RepID=A0A365YMU0_9MICC|nr:Fe-S cluster assembly protein SufD [Glutamicibacter soli]RBM04031.1 Fe-S cluster assembly protein SufD [Glutamicibacter soli]